MSTTKISSIKIGGRLRVKPNVYALCVYHRESDNVYLVFREYYDQCRSGVGVSLHKEKMLTSESYASCLEYIYALVRSWE